jgi:hypothetical protein
MACSSIGGPACARALQWIGGKAPGISSRVSQADDDRNRAGWRRPDIQQPLNARPLDLESALDRKPDKMYYPVHNAPATDKVLAGQRLRAHYMAVLPLESAAGNCKPDPETR